MSGLGPHEKHNRRENPCPICQKVGGCLTFADGMTLCLRVEGDAETASGWHVHRPASDDWRDREFPPPPRPTQAKPEADPALCDKVYRFALDSFKLTADELADLRRDRHLTDEQIAHHGPFARVDPARLDSFAGDAVARFGDRIVGAVPGFYRRNGQPAFAADAGGDGLLLPIRDIDGRIVRLRVRPNLPKKKYAWISSGERSGGLGSGAPIGVYVPSRAGWDWTRVGVAEGEFKSIAVAERFNIPVVCVPGVNVTAGVRDLLLVVEAEQAIVFYDADTATNRHVAAAEQRLASDLFGAGLTVLRAVWSLAVAKGIDDLLNLGGVPLLEPFTLADAETTAGPGLLRERERLAADLAEARRTISGMVHTFMNPHMSASEKIALISALNLAEQKRQRGEVRSDGSVELSAAEIAQDWRPEPAAGESIAPTNGDGSKPRMKRQQVKPVMTVLVERGLIPATPRSTMRPRANGAPYRDTSWHTTLPEKPSEVLARAATWKPETPKVRKPRTQTPPCPHCGEVHAVVRSAEYHCQGCGGLVNVEKTVIEPITDVVADSPLADAPMSPNSRDIELTKPGGSQGRVRSIVPKNRGHREVPVEPYYLAAAPLIDEMPTDSVGVAWLAGTALPTTPPTNDLAPARDAMREADLATGATDPREFKWANGALAATMNEYARSIGRTPVPKPVTPPRPAPRRARPDYHDFDEVIFGGDD